MTQPDGPAKNDDRHPMNWPTATVNIIAILALAAIVITCIWSRA